MSATFTTQHNPYQTIRHGDPDFLVQVGLTIISRASIEISEDCTREHRLVIATALDQGWIQPVAHVHRDFLAMEQTWRGLASE